MADLQNPGDTPDTHPIFIVGSVHSGTTLLRRIIESDPSISSTRGETNLFAQDKRLKRVFGDLQDRRSKEDFLKFTYCRIRLHSGVVPINIRKIRECFKNNQFPQAHIDELLAITADMSSLESRIAVFDYVAQTLGKRRWLEKTPAHVLHVSRILPFKPSAKVIELVRDPRDVLASKKARRAPDASNLKALKQSFRYDATLEAIAWHRAVRAGANARTRYPKNILQVRYEDLVRDPAGVVIQVSRFLGLDADALEINVPWRNSTTVSRDLASEAISDKAVGRGLRELPQRDLAICQMVNRRYMTQLGYELSEFGFSTMLQAYSAPVLSSVGLIRRTVRS